jgi:serine/threonine protein kinase
MWSVGIITGTLLSGRMLWAVQHSVRSETEFRTAVGALAAECDLGFLDDRQDRVWRNVGSKPKDFIRKLVVLEEKQRMTAHEALKHPWFTNSCHAAAFTSVYEKAIRNWRCHRPDMPLVEPLSQVSPELPKFATSGRFLTQEVISRHFAPPRGSSNSTLSSNQDAVQYPSGSQLPSMGEETGKQGLNSAQSVSAPCNDLRENIHLNQDDLNSNIDRLPVTRKYSNNGDVDPQGQLLVAKSSDNIYEGMDSIYQFSIPKPPPQVADDDEDSLLVPETPHSNAEKYRQQLPDCTPLREKKYGAGTTVKRTAQVYSAQKLSKRPKLCQ